jgi:hypothetical protein
MIKRSRPTIVKQVGDKRPQAPLPDADKSQVISKEAQDLNDKPAAKGFTVEDEDRIAFEHARSRVKEALGIDDDDFCTGIVRQLEKLTNWGHWTDQDDFNFVLSLLKDARPVDKFHALIYVQIAVCQLVVMKQAEVLLAPVRFELPADFQSALHNAKYDTRRLDKQKIRVDDLPVRQSGVRAFSNLIQASDRLVKASIAYRNSVQPLVKGQQVSASAGGQDFLSDATKAVRHKTRKRGLNGSQHSAAGFTDNSKQMNSINGQKGNGHASS